MPEVGAAPLSPNRKFEPPRIFFQLHASDISCSQYKLSITIGSQTILESHKIITKGEYIWEMGKFKHGKFRLLYRITEG